MMLPPVTREAWMSPRRLLSTTIFRSIPFQQSATTSPKHTSPHIGFYKTFGRPVVKVLLMATFTYQLTYWIWVKLEKDEIKLRRRAEISALEAKLQEIVKDPKNH